VDSAAKNDWSAVSLRLKELKGRFDGYFVAASLTYCVEQGDVTSSFVGGQEWDCHP
jgi:hypothetical protein